MSLEALRSILPPPTNPLNAVGDIEWSELKLGIRLPEDYKRFVAAYGTGRICDFLDVLNPFVDHPRLNLVEAQKELSLCLQGVDWPDGRAVDTRRPGLLLVARTDNGDDLFWNTRGAPDAWTIVERRDRDWTLVNRPMTLTAFLAALLSGAYDSWNEVELETPPRFTPYTVSQ